MPDNQLEELKRVLLDTLSEKTVDEFTNGCFINGVFNNALFNLAVYHLCEKGQYGVLTKLIMSLKENHPKTFDSCLKKQ